MLKEPLFLYFFCCGTGWNFANADVRTSVTGFWSTAWRMGWPSGAKRGSITSLGRWWRCIVGLSAWENSDSVLQKVTFCWIGFSARTRKVLDGGMPTKRFFLDDGDPRFCGCLVDLQGYQHCFWAFFWPEIRSLRGRIVARTAACPDYDKLIDRDWDWNTHCQKKLCAIYFSGGMESHNSFLLGLLYGCYMCDIARWGNLRLHHDITMPHIRAGCTLQPACLAAIAGRMWHC